MSNVYNKIMYTWLEINITFTLQVETTAFGFSWGTMETLALTK